MAPTETQGKEKIWIPVTGYMRGISLGQVVVNYHSSLTPKSKLLNQYQYFSGCPCCKQPASSVSAQFICGFPYFKYHTQS